MPTKKVTPKQGQKPLAPTRPLTPHRQFDPRDLGKGSRKGKTRGGRPPLFPGRTGGR